MCELAVGYRDATLHVSVFIIIMVYTHAACTFKYSYCSCIIV